MTPLSIMIALAVAALLLCGLKWRTAAPITIDWRGVLARLPLPMLALAGLRLCNAVMV